MAEVEKLRRINDGERMRQWDRSEQRKESRNRRLRLRRLRDLVWRAEQNARCTRRYAARRRATNEMLLALYGWKCHICHQPLDISGMDRDHLVPVSLGGTDELDNLAPAHKFCNRSRQASPIEEARESYASLPDVRL